MFVRISWMCVNTYLEHVNVMFGFEVCLMLLLSCNERMWLLMRNPDGTAINWAMNSSSLSSGYVLVKQATKRSQFLCLLCWDSEDFQWFQEGRSLQDLERFWVGLWKKLHSGRAVGFLLTWCHQLRKRMSRFCDFLCSQVCGMITHPKRVRGVGFMDGQRFNVRCKDITCR